MKHEYSGSSVGQRETQTCETMALPPFGVLLHHANRAFTRMLDAELRALGVTTAQLGPLIIMARSAGPMLQRDLVARSAIGQPAMVTALNLLARHGLISRRRHERDGRATVLDLTDHGRSVVERATPILIQCNARALSGLSSDEEHALMRLTAAVIANIEDSA